MESANLISMKGAIEAILFVSEKPVTLEQIKETLAEELQQKPELMGNGWQSFHTEHLQQALDLLKKEQGERQSALTIVEIAGGFQLLTHPRYASVLRTFTKTRHKEKLSKPALETLAIIAYKQPTIRMDIELIRGVNSDGVVTHLLEKGLIKISGRREVPGRPFLYGTTKEFLECFGLKSLNDLPQLEEFSRSQRATPGESQEDLKTASAATTSPAELVSITIKEEISAFLEEARLPMVSHRGGQARASLDPEKQAAVPGEETPERAVPSASVPRNIESTRREALFSEEETSSNENREIAQKD